MNEICVVLYSYSCESLLENVDYFGCRKQLMQLTMSSSSLCNGHLLIVKMYFFLSSSCQAMKLEYIWDMAYGLLRSLVLHSKVL